MTQDSTNNTQPDITAAMDKKKRLLQEAVMLPSEGTLTAEQRREVIDKVQAYRTHHKITYKALAKEAGISHHIVHKVLNNKYESGGVDEYIRALNYWMENHAARKRSKTQTKFVETRIAKRIINAVRHIVETDTDAEERFIAACHGPAGVGKTKTGQALLEMYSGSIFINIKTGTTTDAGIRRELAGKLNIKTKGKMAHEILDSIYDTLRDSSRLVIFDQAHDISKSGLRFVCDISRECRVPILMLCTIDLVEMIRDDLDEDHGQIFSRFLYFDITGQSADGKRSGSRAPLFNTQEILKVFETESLKFHPDSRTFLMELVNMRGIGSLRIAKGIINVAAVAMRIENNLKPNEKVVLTVPWLKAAMKERFQDDRTRADLAHPLNLRFTSPESQGQKNAKTKSA